MTASHANIAAKLAGQPKNKLTLKALDYSEIMALDLPPRKPILGAWLMEQSINMCHGWRGIGKSHFSFNVAYAVATGGAYLGWRAQAARKVLFVDGELPASVVQQRFHDIEKCTGKRPDPGVLKIITPDILGRSAPDLAVLDDQDELDELAEGCDLIILDNLSCLLRSGAAENDAESWVNVSSWALAHRARHRSILIIHHSGKNGAQRGTSRREDLLDVVLALKKPAEYSPEDGARFEVHFEKARHLSGIDVEPFEAHLTCGDGGLQVWQMNSLEGKTDERIIELMSLGLNRTDIARELGCNKSTVTRHVQALQRQGVLPADGLKTCNPSRNRQQKPLDV